MIQMRVQITSAKPASAIVKDCSRDLRCLLLVGSGFAAAFAWMPTFAVAQQSQNSQRSSAIDEEQQIDPFSPRNRAGFLGYSLSLSPRFTYSDNVNLDPSGQEVSDGLASAELRGGLLVDRVNFTGIVNGRIEVGSYFDPPNVGGQDLYDQVVVDHNVRAAGTAEFVDNLLYLDLAGATERRALDERSRFSSQSIAANDQLADSYSFSASPYVLTKFSNDSSLEARYRYVNVQIDDKDGIQGIDNFLNDSETHEVVAEYSSGKLLDRLSFSLRAYANQTDETGSDILPVVDYDQATVSGSVRYPLSRKVSVIGTVGYDDIDTNNNPLFDDDKLSGIFWKAGLLATPGRRTEAQLEIGERFGGTLVEGLAEYKYSSRLRFQADINRTFNTSSQLQSNNASVLQSETLAFAEELRLLQNTTASDVLNRTLQFNDDLRDLSERRSGLATSNNASFAAIAKTKRDDFVLRAGYDDADFGFQQTDTISLSGAWNRRLSRNLNLYARGTYQDSSTNINGTMLDCITALSTDPATAGLTNAAITQLCQDPANFNADTQTASVLGGIGYTIFKDVSAFIQYARTQRFAEVDSLEFEENALTVGLTLDF